MYSGVTTFGEAAEDAGKGFDSILAVRLLGSVRKFEIQVGNATIHQIPYLNLQIFSPSPTVSLPELIKSPYLCPQLHPQMLSHQNTFNGTINPNGTMALLIQSPTWISNFSPRTVSLPELVKSLTCVLNGLTACQGHRKRIPKKTRKIQNNKCCLC